MKILLWPLHYLPNIGGLEVMSHSLAKQLKAEGHEVLVIANNIQTREIKKFVINNITVYEFPFMNILAEKNLSLLKEIFKKLSEIVDEYCPDILNIHGWLESFSFYHTRVIQQKKLPTILTIHGLLEQKSYKTPECLKLWNSVKAVNLVSHAVAEELVHQGMPTKRIQVIHNGLAVSSKPIKPIPQEPYKILMVGRLTGEKGFDLGFRAVSKLIQKYPQLTLTLIGDGILFEELQQLKRKLKLGKHVTMKGFVKPEEVKDYMDNASLVLVPSDYESFGLVALEAAMRGRPVIASDVCGLKEVVKHGETGLLVPPQDPDALANAIEQLLQDPIKIDKMGAAALKRAGEVFTIEASAQAYVALYQEVLNEQTI